MVTGTPTATASAHSSSMHLQQQHSKNSMNHHRFQHMNRLVDEDESPFLMEGIKYPGANDVMLGRGGESTYHCGNISFRQLVEDHKNKYYAAPRANKSRVVAEVVRKWRSLAPPGRFLTRTHPGWGDESPWHDVGDRRALKKASHSLRDAVRCFTQERREREKEERQKSHGDSTSSSSSSLTGSENEATMRTTSMDNRKRSRVIVVPERATSHNNKGSRPYNLSGSEFIAVSGHTKHTAPLNFHSDRNNMMEQRAAKRRRVVCDEREEEQEDCRREGSEDDDGHEDEAAPNNRREDSSSSASAVVPQQTALFSPFVWNAHTEKPAPGLLHLSAVHRTVSASNSSSRAYQRLNNRSASPCGSADWFTNMEGLPVQAPPSQVLPTAEVLVREVNDEDEDGQWSDGWFSDNDEEEEHLKTTPLFTASPFLLNSNVAPFRPVPQSIQVCQGREL